MAIVTGRLKNKLNTILSIIWERDASTKSFEGVHDRFQNDSTLRDSYLGIDRTEEVCIQKDKDAQKDFTYRLVARRVLKIQKKNWWISLNTSGRNEPMKLRSDFNEALTTLHRLHRESGEERLAPVPFLAIPEMASVVFFIQCILVTVERFLVELIKNHKKSSTSELVKEQHIERGDPLCSFFTKLLRSDTLQDFFVVRFVHSWHDSSLLQPTGSVNSTLHTSHFFVFAH